MKKTISRKSHDFNPAITAALEQDVDYVALAHRHGQICAEILSLREERDQVDGEISLASTGFPDEASAIAAGALPISGASVAVKRQSATAINSRLRVLEQAAQKLATEMALRKQDLARQMYTDTFRDEQLAVAAEMVDALLFFAEQTSVETSRLFDLQRTGVTMSGYPRVGIPRLASAAFINEYLAALKPIGYQPSLERQQRVDALRKLELENAR